MTSPSTSPLTGKIRTTINSDPGSQLQQPIQKDMLVDSIKGHREIMEPNDGCITSTPVPTPIKNK